MARRIAWALAILLLLVSGVLGVYNGSTEWADARTALQRSVTGGVLLYGVLGLVTGVGLLRRQRWSLPLAIAWGVVVTYVPGAAVMAYGGPDATPGAALAASLGAAFVALLVVAAAYASTRTKARPEGVAAADVLLP